jgi:photosystem II stability/assembly factor-like uncharacterized protein
VAVGGGGTILRTVDGGRTWATIASPTLVALHAIGFSDADPALGWAVGDGGTILRTVDGGASFTQLASPVRADLNTIEDM